jgi:transcriptional antiterminator RfaH
MNAWYAIQTKPHAEMTALENLVRQGYRVYLPRCRVRVSHARRRIIALRPLFPRYLFAGFDRSQKPWRPIRSTHGVSDVVRVGDEPIAVPDAVIDALRQQEQAGTFDRVTARQSFRVGDLVRVTEGAFGEMIGRLVELRDRDQVVVLLELLGRIVRAHLDAAALQAA